MSNLYTFKNDPQLAEFFPEWRWEETGEPFCPGCGERRLYILSDPSRPYKCVKCGKRFSATSGTTAHSHKIEPALNFLIMALIDDGYSDAEVAREVWVNSTTVGRLRRKWRPLLRRHPGRPLYREG